MTRRHDSIQLRELLEEVGWVCRLARHLLVDEHQAEDAIQETWVVVLESPPRDRGDIRGWLATVLQNVVRKKRRSETARRGRQASFPPPEYVVERVKIHRGVVDAVLRLKEPYRTTILYRFLEDRSASEIATHFGVPVRTVRTRLQRGLQQLRTRLDRAYGGVERRGQALGPRGPKTGRNERNRRGKADHDK